MDFKVAGTAEFVKELQLDTKLDGIPSEVLAGRAQPGQGRPPPPSSTCSAEAIDGPDEMSRWAPRVVAIKVPVDKIGEVIGPKGKMINSITEPDRRRHLGSRTTARSTSAPRTAESAEAAIGMINAIANPQLPKVGERFLGTVVKTAAFGAFVSLRARQGRPGAHLEAGQRQAHRQGRGRGEGRRQASASRSPTSTTAARSASSRSSRRTAAAAPAPRRMRRQRPTPGRGLGELTPVTDVITAGGGGCFGDLRPRPLRDVAVPNCRAGCASSPRRWRACGLARGSGSVSAPATRPPSRRRRPLPGTPVVQGHAAAHPPGRSPRSSTPSAATSTRSPRRSTPATTRTSWTPTCRSRWRCSADVVTDATLHPRRGRRVERSVVLEEIAMRDDDPEDLLGRSWPTEALFADHPLGRPVIGSEDSIRGDGSAGR